MLLIGLISVGLLFFVWPLPHTISIRDLLLLFLLGVFGWLAWRARPPTAWWRELRLPLILFGILTLWLYVVAVAISPETAWSLDEIRGQWLKGAAAGAAGLLTGLALHAGKPPARAAFLAIFLALVAHVLYLDFAALAALVQDGSLPRRVGGLTDGPDRLNYLANILFAFVLTAILARRHSRRGRLFRDRVLPAFLLAAILFSIYVTEVRNSVVPLVSMILVFGVLYHRHNRGRMAKAALWGIIALALGGIVLFAFLSTASDKRWEDLWDTIPLALDTRTHKAWLDWEKYPTPRLPDGEPVSHSNYVRIAWAKEGGLLVRDHPLGVGFGRDAFEVGLRQKYGEGRGYSHSGILDLAIGTGIPGAVLWLGFLGSLFVLAWRRFAVSGSPPAMLLLLALADFGSRMFVDSIIRDHMLQQFLFLVGLASVTMCLEGRRRAEGRVRPTGRTAGAR